MQDKLYIYKSRKDNTKVTLSVYDYFNDDIEKSSRDIESRFGKTILMSELIMLWKKDNGKNMVIDKRNQQDWDMITNLFNSENILTSSNEKTIRK